MEYLLDSYKPKYGVNQRINSYGSSIIKQIWHLDFRFSLSFDISFYSISQFLEIFYVEEIVSQVSVSKNI